MTENVIDRTRRIEIYDPSDYEGPDPMKVNGIGVVYGPERTEYYLVEVDQPLKINGYDVAQLLLRPRYFEDKISRVENDACTIGILLVKPEITLEADLEFDIDNTVRWGAGKITPCKLK
jgi:hypothetical protein